MSALEDHYKLNLRHMQHLPKSTATPALYLLMGVPPMEAQVHIRTLNFFASALKRPESIEYRLIERQLAMKSSSSHSWVWYAQALLKRYGLPSAFSLLQDRPKKEQWKKSVRAAVSKAWETDLKSQTKNMPTLNLLNLNACNLHTTHPVWRLGAADPLTAVKATTKAKMLVQRYPLFYSRTSGVHYGHPCPLCNGGPETLAHFLIMCPVLDGARKMHENKLVRLMNAAGLPIPHDENGMVKLILDPSHFAPGPLIVTIETITRDLCFSLHNRRSVLMGYTSKYKHSFESNLLQRRSAKNYNNRLQYRSSSGSSGAPK